MTPTDNPIADFYRSRGLGELVENYRIHTLIDTGGSLFGGGLSEKIRTAAARIHHRMRRNNILEVTVWKKRSKSSN